MLEASLFTEIGLPGPLRSCCGKDRAFCCRRDPEIQNLLPADLLYPYEESTGKGVFSSAQNLKIKHYCSYVLFVLSSKPREFWCGSRQPRAREVQTDLQEGCDDLP